MISEYTRARLSEINKDRYEESDKEFILEETEKEGRARYHLSISIPSLLFKKLDEKWGFDFLKRKKCADHIVFELKSADKCALHIFELKRTITKKTWLRIVEQYNGAYVRGEVIAAFLGLKIEKTTVNACFKEDKLKQCHETITPRAEISDAKLRKALKIRSDEEIDLNCVGGIGGIHCVHKKNILYENGEGCLYGEGCLC
ncbi:MAG: hypothetical protein LBE65_00465 [Synergistaceae bacterium]|jgi:hypothetical protein|nr:hypothetical protein [Synergistaceae bacterium]